jgi:hypothetical protein
MQLLLRRSRIVIICFVSFSTFKSCRSFALISSFSTPERAQTKMPMPSGTSKHTENRSCRVSLLWATTATVDPIRAMIAFSQKPTLFRTAALRTAQWALF